MSMSPKCPECGGVVVPECFGGMALYREDPENPKLRLYRVKCVACQIVSEIKRSGDFPAIAASPFQPGRRWFCGRERTAGRARFWFVIIGPGLNDVGKPSKVHKRCRLEIHPDDLRNQLPGYKSHGTMSTYSHKHLKKYASLEPISV